MWMTKGVWVRWSFDDEAEACFDLIAFGRIGVLL